MKRGGGKGSSTATGLHFERAADLAVLLEEAGLAEIVEIEKNWFDIKVRGRSIAQFFRKRGLYKYLQAKQYDYSGILSSELQPDNALYDPVDKEMLILEMKYQTCPGSVDEKLQTCGFKLQQYKKLLEGFECNVSYTYILNDWFNHPRYADVLNYIEDSGCSYHINQLPLDGTPLSKLAEPTLQFWSEKRLNPGNKRTK